VHSHLLLPAIALISASTAAAAEPQRSLEEQFGERGVWVISGDHGLAWDTGSSFAFYLRRSGETSTSVLRVQPSLDVFVLDHLSLGFTIGFTKITQSTPDAVGEGGYLQLGARLGFSVPLLPGVSSLWPKVSVVLAHNVSNDRVGLQAYLPVAVHSMGHFLVAFGPAIERFTDTPAGDNAVKVSTTAVGVLVTLGGWFRR
jgi:hypothetical protein